MRSRLLTVFIAILTVSTFGVGQDVVSDVSKVAKETGRGLKRQQKEQKKWPRRQLKELKKAPRWLRKGWHTA